MSLVAAPAVAADYAALFERAVDGVTWTLPDNWAYTETRSNKDGTKVARYDPRLAEGERWSLLAVNGREPTVDEIEAFLEDKADTDDADDDKSGEEQEQSGSGTRNRADDMVSPGSLTLLEESDAHWLLAFQPSGDDEEDARFMEAMNGTVRIAKDNERLDYIDITNDKPVKPTTGVKIREFLTRFEFAPAFADGPVVPVSFRFRIRGRAFLAVGFDESETLEFSDFEPLSE